MSKTRRNFLKTTLAAAVALPAFGVSKSLLANNHLTKEQKSDKLLLDEFEEWVDVYVTEIQKEKEQGREFKDNRALVDLPAKMEEMMPKYKARFNNPEFLKEYVKISRKLSQEIDMNF